MFDSDNVLVMISGILLSLGFIIFSVWAVNKLFINSTKDVLVRFILMIFAALVGLFIVDKTIAFKINLLSEQQNNQLFELIKTLTLMIFSYYFGTQKSESK
jgi:hypothetical protein